MRSFLQVFLACLAILLIFILYSCLSGPLHTDPYYSIADIHQPLILKVGLSQFLDTPSANVSVSGSYVVKNMSEQRIGQGLALYRAVITYSNGVIVIGKDNYNANTLEVSPINDGTLEVGDTRYHGDLIIYGLEKNKVALVNKVELEKYLAGVVGKEMPLNSSEQSLKAQIIAARTFAIYAHKTPPEVREQKAETKEFARLFDLYDNQNSQVYGGMEKESLFTVGIAYQTRGYVLSYNGNLFRTYYASTCGGARAAAWDVFPSEAEIPPLGSGKCDFCTSSKYYVWNATFNKKDLIPLLAPAKKYGMLQRIWISKKAPSGHAIELSLEFSGKSQPLVTNAYDVFRRNINGSKLSTATNNVRSTLFEIADNGASIDIHGKGWGHGIGMCQVGAMEMGRLGYTYKDILNYYYPQAQIVKLY